MICRLCGSTDVTNFCEARDYYVSNETFKLLRCNDCRVVYTDYSFVEGDYKLFYQGGYYAHTEAHLRPALRERVQRMSLCLQRGDSLPWRERLRTLLLRNFLLVDLPFIKNGKLLDVGCGAGKLLRVAQSVGFECYGAEPSESARELLEKDGIKSFPDVESVDVENHYFDVIVFNQSLEHIADPMSALKRAVDLLKSGGLLIISVPNFDSNERRAFGMYWRHVDVPRHLFHFQTETLDIIAGRLGLMSVGGKYKFWGGPGVAFQMAKEYEGINAYKRMLVFGLLQIGAFILRKQKKSGQMMAMKYRKV